MVGLRILLYGLNFAPELTGIGKYTGEMAEWLARRGHEVRVVTAPPYYPAWRIRDDYRGAGYHVERPMPGLEVWRVPLYVPERPTGIKRMLHLLSFAAASLPVMARQMLWRPDLIWTVEPTFFGVPVALLLGYAMGTPTWLHVQDFEIDAAFDLGLLPAEGPVHALALWLEQIFTRAFDQVSSISVRMSERAERKGVAPERIVLFPNWVDVDAIQPAMEGAVNPFREELGLGAKTVLLYSGNMGNKQGLEMLGPLAAALDEDPEVHLVLCGDGAFRPQLEELVGGRRNVTLLPLQPTSRLKDLLNLADIHLMPQRAHAADLVMPSKLTGMLSSGRPVLVTADAGTMLADVVGGQRPEEALGIVVPTGDAAALVEGARELIRSPEQRRVMGRNARRYAVRELGREEVLGRFEDEVMTLIHGTSVPLETA